MNKSAQLIARIKEVQLRGNTAPRDLGLLDEIVEHLQELDAAPRPTAGWQSVPVELSDAQIADACLWYRHDFGLLSEDERRTEMGSMREHYRAICKALNTPGRGQEFAAPPAGDDLARLEREIAEQEAKSVICSHQDGTGWANLEYAAGFDDHIEYLELRGLLEHHPEQPELVRMKEET